MNKQASVTQELPADRARRPLSEGELTAALRRPSTYLRDGDDVGYVETHISRVFLVGDRVYKVKKPVDLGFLDYTTPEARLRFCEEEVRLNRRLAPDIYLGVVPIVRTPEGCVRVGTGVEGEVLEHAVEMLRLPAERMLDRLLERGEVDNELMDRLADKLVKFHHEAATGDGVDEHGTVQALRNRVEEDLASLECFAGRCVESESSTLSETLLDFLGQRLRGFLDSHTDLLERRVETHHIREGHGDLHAGNICYVSGEPIIYDCIEFSPALRCGDVASDLAFLAMDLDFRGLRGFSSYLVRRYAQLTDDPELPKLMRFYKTQRALVRGKVESIRGSEKNRDPEDRTAAHHLAEHYFQLAASYQLPPGLILMCGLPATGKSWLARHLAAPFEALVMRSDVRRKTLAGLSPTARTHGAFGTGLYAPEAVEHTYQVLLDEAITALDQGRTVIIDATFSTGYRRRRFIDAAARMGHPVVLVHVTCPYEVVHMRLEHRACAIGEPSDADWEVYRRASETFESPSEVHPEFLVEAGHHHRWEHTASRVIDHFIRQPCRRPSED